MNGPKTVTISWEKDYTLPFVLISLTVLAIVGAIIALYYFVVRPRLKAEPVQQQLAPAIPPFPATPVPQPQTTVVMINDARSRSPITTKEQLMEKFGELLEIYEREIRESLGAPTAPTIAPVAENRQIPGSMTAALPGATKDIAICNDRVKKFVRTVVTPWQQSEMKTVVLPETDKNQKKGEVGLAIVWTRSLYNEWQVSTCTLPHGHEGVHEGTKKMLYNLLNTVTEERMYGPNQPVTAPSPHFTDGMPEIAIDPSHIVLADDLPQETMR